MQDSCDRQEILKLFKSDSLRQFRATTKLGLNVNTVVLFIDAPCLHRCLFCGAHLRPPRMTAHSAKPYAVLKNCRNEGITKLLLLGEEVLNHPDILNIITRARNHGFKEIEIQSSGEPLADKKFMKDIVSCGATAFSFPLYGEQKIHDRLVNHPGSYRKLMIAINNLRNHSSAKIFLHTILTRANLFSLAYTVRLTLDCGSTLGVIPLKPKRFICDGADWLVPLDEAAEVVPKEGIEWLNFPLCFIQKVQSKLFSRILKHRRNYRIQPFKKLESKVADSLFFYTRVFNLRLSYFCHGCAVKNACPGIFRRYEQVHGTRGLNKCRAL